MIVLGLMSGTSLDGLDLALCEFDCISGSFSYKIIAGKTIAYSASWKKRLNEIKTASAVTYFALHSAYGKYIAEEINVFLKAAEIKPDAIASHGHTIFHNPGAGFTSQLGCGATIAAFTGITTVCDFRSLDVALGGQGAPLVPIGDRFLFPEAEACLNIGGIANISFDNEKGGRIAYDVCEANMLLNFLSERVGKAFDKGGEIAKTGIIDAALLEKLNGLEYYNRKGAKSIGREWFEEHIEKLLDTNKQVNDLLATGTEHIAAIIATELNNLRIKKLLVTGGGAFNSFLIQSIRSKTSCEIQIPKEEVINFKEALIFAFLGYLRLNENTNTLASVTGATRNSVGGAVYHV